MDIDILVYSETQNSRTSYIFSYLLTELLGLKIQFANSREEAIDFKGPVIFYCNHDFSGKFCVKPYGLLNETGVKSQEIETGIWDGLIVLFPSESPIPLPFDIFSAAFWMISRYEEYQPFKKDMHGRFPASNSLAFRSGFLELPVVNLWTMRLGEALRRIYPSLKIKKNKFQWLATIDVDVPWAYKNYNLYKTLGGLVTSFFKGKDFIKRINVLLGREPDPFFCYNSIREIHQENSDKLLFFFPCGRPGKYDLNSSPLNREWRKLVSSLSDEFVIGLHPSYRSGDSIVELQNELTTLSSLINSPVLNSRQHFLKIEMPETYRSLISMGIHNDYSMGYPDRTGFRAGVCTPYYFYDLLKEEKTTLKIWPLTLMDRTLKDYGGKSPGQSLDIIRSNIDIVEQVGGWFIPAWHNDSLSDYGEWKGWKELYLTMLEILKSKT